MGWLITAAILLLLAILPLGARILYDSDGVCVRVIAGPLKITVFPLPKKKGKKKGNEKKKQPAEKKTDKPKKKEDAQKPQPVQARKTEDKPQKGGSLTDFLPLVKVGIDFLGSFRRKLRLNNIYLKLIMAGDDPCDLAVNYGRAWAALANLLPVLERAFVIGKRDLEVECDFTSDKTVIIARLDISITLGRLISLAVVYGFRGLNEFLKFRKKRKGGAKK